jgi:membrane protease YdiL (CAAX protease family)
VPVPFRIALPAWFVAWVVGGLVLGGIALGAMGADADELSIGEIAVLLVLAWATFAVALFVVSQRSGTGNPLADFGLSFRPVDALAIPVGVIGQLVLIPALYWPLQQIWSGTFSDEQLEERAVELADRADGVWVWVLVAAVVVGAPLFEELVYRGLLQRSLADLIGRAWGLVAVSALFSLVHLSPVEYPGLFVAGLLFGAALLLTDRLGPAIIAHASFNAAGIAMAFNADQITA